MKARLKKKRFIRKLDQEGIDEVQLNSFDEDSIFNFMPTKKQLLIFGAVAMVALLSAFLRVTGIVDIFKISEETAWYIVGTFIFAEIAIANVFISDTQARNKIVELLVLGSVQIVLIGLSFILEFSALSNKIAVTKNENTFVIEKEKVLNEQKASLTEQLVLLKSEYNNLPDNRLTLRQKTLKQIDEVNKQKASVDVQIKELYADEENAKQKIHGVTLEHTANLLGVSEHTLTKYMMIIIAGILNILYVMLLYAGIKLGYEDEDDDEDN